MRFGKKAAFLVKIVFICAFSASLAVAFNMNRPHPLLLQGMSSQQQNGIVELGTPEVLELYDSGNVIMVDARSPMDFAMGHVPGALNIPATVVSDEFDELVNAIEKAQAIIIYCDGLSCGKSMILANKMSETGFSNLSIYTDGIDGWLSAGRDMEAE